MKGVVFYIHLLPLESDIQKDTQAQNWQWETETLRFKKKKKCIAEKL